MHTNKDAHEYVAQCIEAGEAKREEFDIEAITDDLYIAWGTYDFASADDPELFWKTVERHAR